MTAREAIMASLAALTADGGPLDALAADSLRGAMLGADTQGQVDVAVRLTLGGATC
jgi:hypothetical protein